MSVQEVLSYAMSIIRSLNLDTYITAAIIIFLAAMGLKALIGVFRRD